MGTRRQLRDGVRGLGDDFMGGNYRGNAAYTYRFAVVSALISGGGKGDSRG